MLCMQVVHFEIPVLATQHRGLTCPPAWTALGPEPTYHQQANASFGVPLVPQVDPTTQQWVGSHHLRQGLAVPWSHRPALPTSIPTMARAATTEMPKQLT